jgi:plastocyanin
MRIALIAVASLATLACSSSTDNSNPPPSSDVAIVSGAATKGATAYNPSPFSISLATHPTVKWGNGDGTTHTITDNAGGFDSNTLAAGDSYTHTFTATGTYNYHCKIHRTMTGIIIVNP